ncbi:hypothetical protein NMY22_g3820 [Coprinellus aureogranulatus]|nr:hypothetical protein NMY22_g3820 [Coprinellus aureogranulatus]
MPSLTATQALGTALGAWALWRLFRLVFPKDPFANIPGPPPDSLVLGNVPKLMNKDGWEDHQAWAKTYGRVFSFATFFGRRQLYVYDPKALHHIVVKDQYTYEESSDFILTNLRTFGPGLLSTLGDHHKKQRKMLNPVFSTAHMRDMTPTFYGVAHKLVKGLSQQVSEGRETIDVLEWMTRTALELIGQSGFGYSFDDLEPDGQQHPFALSLKNLFRAYNTGWIAFFRFTIHKYVFHWGGPRFQRALVDAIPYKPLRELRDMVDVMDSTSKEILNATKRALAEGKDSSSRIGGGKDIMSILVKANMAASEEDKLPENELLAQISTLTFAGMDTTSNALARILDILSNKHDVQDKLRQEIVQAYEQAGGDLDFDTLMNLPYLDAVCRETLRLYSPVAFLAREVNQDIVMPLSKPIIGRDGKEISEIFLPNGTRVLCSLIHCNADPEIWGPDSEEWKPERWLAPLPDTVAEAKIPGVYSHLFVLLCRYSDQRADDLERSHRMTFIGGNRACIGFKFSQLEMKVVLSLLLQTFKFDATGKKVMWQLNGITQPTTEDAELTAVGERKLQLPLRVSFLK